MTEMNCSTHPSHRDLWSGLICDEPGAEVGVLGVPFDGAVSFRRGTASAPDKLRELQELFLIEAAKYDVFPLDDRRYERFNAAIAGRPDLTGDRKTMTFYAGMDTLMENTVLNVKNRSHTITAEVEVSAGKTDGVIVAQGGRFAGWSLYVKDNAAKYVHNWFDADYYYVGGDTNGDGIVDMSTPVEDPAVLGDLVSGPRWRLRLTAW